MLSACMLFYAPHVIGDNDTASKYQRIVRLATTTSTDNSGLLNDLLPAFESETGFKVHVIAVGTGKAIRMGRDGDADVLLVHAPAAEIEFVNAGYGDKRVFVMYNDFVLVGPATNTASITISDNFSKALQQIAAHELTFISRGDNSGTHKKELALWKSLDITPQGGWYREVGQGMGKVLQMASEMDAYTLADRGTWLAYQDKTNLKILNQPDPQLYNPYHIIAVNPVHDPASNYTGASALIAWISSAPAQSLIGAFRINNTVLFTPSSSTAKLARQGSSR